MSFLLMAQDAIGFVYLRIGRAAKVSTAIERRLYAIAFTSLWLGMIFLSFGAFFNHWVFDLEGVLKGLYPYQSRNFRDPRSLSFLLFFSSWILGFIATYPVSRRVKDLLDDGGDGISRDRLIQAGAYVALIFLMLLARNKYGSILTLAANLVFFWYMVRISRKIGGRSAI
jgi:hypothetical protein